MNAGGREFAADNASRNRCPQEALAAGSHRNTSRTVGYWQPSEGRFFSFSAAADAPLRAAASSNTLA
jgi:hypothetical protein